MSRLLPLPAPPAHNKRFILAVLSFSVRCVVCGVCWGGGEL